MLGSQLRPRQRVIKVGPCGLLKKKLESSNSSSTAVRSFVLVSLVLGGAIGLAMMILNFVLPNGLFHTWKHPRRTIIPFYRGSFNRTLYDNNNNHTTNSSSLPSGLVLNMRPSGEIIQSAKNRRQWSNLAEKWRSMADAQRWDDPQSLRLRYRFYSNQQVSQFLNNNNDNDNNGHKNMMDHSWILNMKGVRSIEVMDYFRYAAVFERGGIWADYDTDPKVPPQEWLSRFHHLSSHHESSHSHHSYSIVDFQLIIGVEFPLNFQITQWVFYAPYSHSPALSTVLRICKKRLRKYHSINPDLSSSKKSPPLFIKLSDRPWIEQLSSQDTIMDLTGPRMWTEALIDYMYRNLDPHRMDLESCNGGQKTNPWKASSQYPCFIDKPSKLDKRGQIIHLGNGDRPILLLPYRAFGVHRAHPHNKNPLSQQLVRHQFSGSWRQNPNSKFDTQPG